VSDHVLVSQAAGVLRIQMNRAEKRNALTRAMYTSLAEALEGADANPAIHVITITGVGDVFHQRQRLEGLPRRFVPRGPTIPSCASCRRSLASARP